MKKYLLPFIVLFSCITAVFGQSEDTYEIRYTRSENGKQSDRTIDLFYQNGILYLSQEDAKIQNFTDFNSDRNIDQIKYNGKKYLLFTPFSNLPKGESEETTDKILGYKCKKMNYVSFSNSISIWYTEEATPKGSPLSFFLPNDKALVLKAVINGNREITATSIKKIKKLPRSIFSDDNTISVNSAEFEELKIKSRYTKVSVFENEQIHFAPKNYEKTPEQPLKIDSTYHFSHGSVILKKIKLTEAQKNSPYVFAELTCQSNGDAYDRTGSVFVLPNPPEKSMLKAYLEGVKTLPIYTDNNGTEYQGIVKTDNYEPVIEVMRFFTPFGVNYFNDKRPINNYNWEDKVYYKQDISRLFPQTDEIWVGVFIGNYDGGGHKVSLDLSFYPGEDSEGKNQKFILPLVSTINTLEMSGQNYGRLFDNDTLQVDFEVPEGLKNPVLYYTSTGHGGWGSGDEFNPKMNRVFLDGNEIFTITPWRTDCGTYRLLNPASGNFSNGLSSSDYSRSNWCPGTLTPPYLIPVPQLSAGKHSIRVAIDQGPVEGNSFSHWGVSVILVGEKE